MRDYLLKLLVRVRDDRNNEDLRDCQALLQEKFCRSDLARVSFFLHIFHSCDVDEEEPLEISIDFLILIKLFGEGKHSKMVFSCGYS